MMNETLEGFAKVLCQSEILWTLFGEVDAQDSYDDHVYIGTTEGESTVPDCYMVLSVAGSSNTTFLSFAGDSHSFQPNVRVDIFVSGATVADKSLREIYALGLGLYGDLIEDVRDNFMAGESVYALDGTGRLAMTAVEVDDSLVSLYDPGADEPYYILGFTLIGAPV